MTTYLEESTYSLTEYESQIAHNIARILAEEQINLNRQSKSNSDGIKTELEKTIAYLYAKIHQDESKSNNNLLASLFIYLDCLIKYGKQVGHTGNIPKYYESIHSACEQYFDIKQDDATRVLTILGWSARLIRFYKQKIESGEVLPAITPVVKSTPETKSQTITNPSQKFEIDQILNAIVVKINGNKVSYQVENILIPNEKEPKQVKNLREKQTIKVKVTAIKEDGSIKHVKYYSS
ncbi:hypothetical protein [Anabaena sp. CCY 9910]|uniref:hypothetical protein n=1 Tax=Anabaena sp. CCY 9910 TaxID=3103870 RepID=UPI0039E00679